MSSHSNAHSQNSSRIHALESVVAKISTQVTSNEQSLKQVLDGQNLVTELLIRCLKGESGNTLPVSIPPSLVPHLTRNLSSPEDTVDAALQPTAPPAMGGVGDFSVPEETVHASLSREATPPSIPEHLTPSVEPPAKHVPPTKLTDPLSPAQPRPSWMSGSTVLITPSMDLRNPNFPRPHSPSVISTSVSHSIRAPSPTAGPIKPFLDGYFDRNEDWRGERIPSAVDAGTTAGTEGIPSSPSGGSRVATRQKPTTEAEEGTLGHPPRERIRHGLLMLPRLTTDPIACNKPVYILHPDFPDKVVAEGKSGGSWKCRTQRLGHLCSQGEQMVQVHSVSEPGCKLMHIEERQPFAVLGDAVVKKFGSSIFVKWNTRYLVRNTT